MTTTAIEPVDTVDTAAETTDDEVLAEVLVEEISIDGMCGVY
jgi:mycofactocin precursor